MSVDVNLKSTSGDPVSHRGDPKTDSDPLQSCSYFVAHLPQKMRPWDPETLLAVVIKDMWTETVLGMLFDINLECFTRKSSSRKYSKKTFIGSDPKLHF